MTENEKESDIESLYLASILVGYFLLLSTWYRRYYLSSEGAATSLPSWLALKVQPGCASVAWPLSYMLMKYVLFLCTMVALLGALYLFFRPRDRLVRYVSYGLFGLVLLMQAVEVRLVSPQAVGLTLVTFFAMLGCYRVISFRCSLTFFVLALLWGVGRWDLGILGVGLLGGLWWSKTAKWSTTLLGSCFIVSGLWCQQEYLVLWGLLVILLGVLPQEQEVGGAWKALAVGGVLILPILPLLGHLSVPNGGLSAVKVHYRFKSGDSVRDVALLYSARGRLGPEVRLVDDDSQVSMVREGSEILFSKYWVLHTNLSNTHMQSFYQGLHNKIAASAPGWSCEASITKHFVNGNVTLEQFP